VEAGAAVCRLRGRGLDRVRVRLDRVDDVGPAHAEGERMHLVALAPQAAGERRGVLLGATDDLRRPEVGHHQDPQQVA
jgi:hypothetical protein